MRRVDEECVHWVKLAAYLTSALWDAYSVLAFARMMIEDEPILISVDGVVNRLAIVKDLVVLK